MKIFDLVFTSNYYYIKRKKIVGSIPFNNRTFYPKFERIEEKPSPLLVQQHLSRHYTIALPLIENNRSNYLYIEYKGKDSIRFYHLIKHLFKSLGITDYHIYKGKEETRLQIFIKVKNLSLEEAQERLDTLSEKLTQKMPKEWECLPSIHLPNDYNIVTLPYGRYSIN